MADLNPRFGRLYFYLAFSRHLLKPGAPNHPEFLDPSQPPAPISVGSTSSERGQEEERPPRDLILWDRAFFRSGRAASPDTLQRRLQPRLSLQSWKGSQGRRGGVQKILCRAGRGRIEGPKLSERQCGAAPGRARAGTLTPLHHQPPPLARPPSPTSR